MPQAITTFHTRRGMTITSSLTNEEAVAICATLQDNTFAAELAAKYHGRSGLSSDQMAWAHKLACESLAPATPPPAPIEGLRSILEFMARGSASGLRHPKVRLKTPEGDRCVFSTASARSRYPGAIFITEGIPEGRLYARIDPDGSYHPYRAHTDSVEALVRAFAHDAAGIAAAHGRATGNCCFCGRDLEDERSTSVGYGPICAERFDLPWGDGGTPIADSRNRAERALQSAVARNGPIPLQSPDDGVPADTSPAAVRTAAPPATGPEDAERAAVVRALANLFNGFRDGYGWTEAQLRTIAADALILARG